MNPQMYHLEACKDRSIAIYARFGKYANFLSRVFTVDEMWVPKNKATNNVTETLFFQDLRNFLFKNLLENFFLQFFGIVKE